MFTAHYKNVACFEYLRITNQNHICEDKNSGVICYNSVQTPLFPCLLRTKLTLFKAGDVQGLNSEPIFLSPFYKF
jgi:hypothetical protein